MDFLPNILHASSLIKIFKWHKPFSLAFFATAIFAHSFCFAAEMIETDFLPFPSNTLSIPEPFKISFFLHQKANEITLEIYSPDNNLIRSITNKGLFDIGKKKIVWDGKDEQHEWVPNEAYQPVIYVKCTSDEKIFLDSRINTPPEFFTPSIISVLENDQITYQLDRPARVQLRAGIENGPMIRELENWQPKDIGVHAAKWNGFDSSNTLSIKDHKDLTLSLSAISLSPHTIIVTGNNEISYPEYHQNNFPGDLKTSSHKRKSSSSAFETPPAFLKKEISLRISTDKDEKINTQELLTINKPTTFYVNLNSQDEWLVNNGKFEVGFFMDYVFSSEAEQYFTPITWTLYPEQYSVGEHILTININGPYGVVVVKNIRVVIL